MAYCVGCYYESAERCRDGGTVRRYVDAFNAARALGPLGSVREEFANG